MTEQKTIKGMMGFAYHNINWADMPIISEVRTGGDDANEFKGAETLGVCTSSLGNYGLYCGSGQHPSGAKCPSFFVHADLPQLITALETLANQLKIYKQPLSEEAKADYIKHGGTQCPFCGSEIIEGHSVELDQGYAVQSITCTACGKDWTDVYKLSRIDEFA